jgi:hypothetical protein
MLLKINGLIIRKGTKIESIGGKIDTNNIP